MSRFEDVQMFSPDEIVGLNESFGSDSSPKKLNLGVGAYRDENGRPWVLPVVREVEEEIARDKSLLHEYLPLLGLSDFTERAVAILLKADNPVVQNGQSFGVQGLSGTGALRIGAEFLAKTLKYDTFYYSNPEWPHVVSALSVIDSTSQQRPIKLQNSENHRYIFLNSGFSKARHYRYWDATTRDLDIAGLVEDLTTAPRHAVIILQACAHNPTGVDPSRDQWVAIADVMEQRELFPFFDSAYQGFASGDLDDDAWPVRYFVSRGFELFCAQSYAKSFGLYDERVGNLAVVTADRRVVPAAKAHFSWLVRGMYLSPPAHGARIVAAILKDPKHFQRLNENILVMASRIKNTRKLLVQELVRLGTPGTWSHITNQVGMFSYTGLTQRQVNHIVKQYHVYLLQSGRINICGLNRTNVHYFASVIHEAITMFP